MPKDRDQLTPAEPEDRGRVPAEATEAVDDDIAPEGAEGAPLGGAAGSGMPAASQELGEPESSEYR